MKGCTAMLMPADCQPGISANFVLHKRGFMKWQRVKERHPADNQEVLIRHRSIVNLATFHEKERVFELRDGTFVAMDSESIQWLELIPA